VVAAVAPTTEVQAAETPVSGAGAAGESEAGEPSAA
jgi:hypothetical protein